MPFVFSKGTNLWLPAYINTGHIPTQTVVEIPMTADTYLAAVAATTNYTTSTVIDVGENNGGVGDIRRTLIQPQWSDIPAGKTFISVRLKITPIVDLSDNARTMRAHRVLRNVNYSQTTWNVFSTGNNWGTAGCSNSTTDYDGAVELGNMSVPASPTLNTPMYMTLNKDECQKFYDATYSNYGIVLFMDTQLNDLIRYGSMDNATAAYRPAVEVTYI